MLVWDGNPFYEGFYEMHQKLWDKLGIKTGLVYVSDGHNAAAIPKTGDVRVVEDRSTATGQELESDHGYNPRAAPVSR
jgi:hypothetical protein